MHSFFIVVNPSFISFALNEVTFWLKELNSDYKVSSDDDGIHLITDLNTGLKLNYLLKIPVRILLRITDFKASDFPKLFKKVSNINWKEFINTSNIIVKSSSHESRLWDSRKIKKAVLDGITKCYNFKKKEEETIYLRFFKNICTISLDLTKDPLFKTGYKQYIAKAPLRENIAYLFIKIAIQNMKDIVLYDPMTGSGTISLVASNFYNESIRQFYFLGKAIQPPKISILNPFKKIIAKDIDISTAMKNITTNAISLMKEDVFDKTQHLDGGEVVVLVNPPYNKRLKVKIRNYYKTLLDAIIYKYQPKIVGMITPKTVNSPKGYEKMEMIRFNNGGIHVEMTFFKKV